MEAEILETPKSIQTVKRKDKFTGKVVKTMLAGAIVDIGLEVPGVVHISQLRAEPVNRIEDVVEVGQSVDVWVKQVIPSKSRIELTMIEPLALEWREIEEGMVVKGTVTRLEKYGAFVEIGAERPGLVHISELAHGYIRSPQEAVSEGEAIEVKVLSVNRRKKQIKLSLKALLEDPAKVVVEVQKPVEAEAEEEDKPVPTAMEMAYKEAEERSRQEKQARRQAEKRNQSANQELEKIFSRTLEQKVKTSTDN
jgi:ribosomal protein S1